MPERRVSRLTADASWWASAKTRLAAAKRRADGWRAERPFVFWGLALGVTPLLSGALAVVLLVWLVYAGAFGKLPSRAAVRNVEMAEASYLLDREGGLIARYFEENRETVDATEIPKLLRDALVATEDARFTEHHGVDWQATARAVIYSGLLGRREQGGGSTLSQQLAKNHFPRSGSGLFRLAITKVKEAITARRFEDEYSKQELLTLYLNSVPFGENLYGVKLAARRFFSKEPSELKAEEAAVLVGMLKANTSYHPVWHPEAARKRRDVVLRRMAAQGYLEAAAADSLQGLPLALRETRKGVRSRATYFSERVKPAIAELLADVRDGDGEPYVVGESGLRVYTTLDPELQRMAETSLQGHLASLQPKFRAHWEARAPEGFAAQLARATKESRRYRALVAEGLDEATALGRFAERRPMTFADYSAFGQRRMRSSYRDSLRAELLRLRGGFVVADPNGEEILAYVGGADHFAVPYNSATARRQVGSTFKPIVYAVAVERGFRPCDYFANERVTYGSGSGAYTPGNADGQYGGEYSMTGALVNSVNTVAVAMAREVSPARVLSLAERMRLTGVEANLATALGTASLSVEDMVRVYGTFARGGTVPEYRMIRRIESREGKVLYEAEPSPKHERALSEETAATMRYMLRQVARRGTGSGLRNRYGVRSDVAGKTGTTQDQADGWFVGFTDDLVVGAWVGAAYPNIRWRSLREGQGARTALPIAGQFLRAYERARGVTRFADLAEEDDYRYACEDYHDGGWWPDGDWDGEYDRWPPEDGGEARAQSSARRVGPGRSGSERAVRASRNRREPSDLARNRRPSEARGSRERRARDDDRERGKIKRALNRLFKRDQN